MYAQQRAPWQQQGCGGNGLQKGANAAQWAAPQGPKAAQGLKPQQGPKVGTLRPAQPATNQPPLKVPKAEAAVKPSNGSPQAAAPGKAAGGPAQPAAPGKAAGGAPQAVAPGKPASGPPQATVAGTNGAMAAPAKAGAKAGVAWSRLQPGVVPGLQPVGAGKRDIGQVDGKAAAEQPAAKKLIPKKKVPDPPARPLDDDEEVLEEEDGEETLKALVADWDGNVVTIADVSAMDKDPTVKGNITQAQAIAKGHYGEDMISTVVKDSGLRMTMLIEDGSTCVGYIVYSYLETVGINVAQIAIADAHRGRGLGRCAVTWLLEHAKKAKHECVALAVDPICVKFYERCGFKNAIPTTPEEKPVKICLYNSIAEGKIEVPKLLIAMAAAAAQGKAFDPAEITLEGPQRGQGKVVKPMSASAKAVEAAAKAAQIKLKLAERAEKLKTIFEKCDDDRDETLNEAEMMVFAVAGGFEGTPMEWKKDYMTICVKVGVLKKADGINFSKFQAVISSGACGKYTDEELDGVVKKLDEKKAKRGEVVKEVFKQCDKDEDELLNASEMMQVVKHIGFSGSDDDWSEEFHQMCTENKADPAKGLNFEQFEKLINDRSDDGCYCSDTDLDAVLERLKRTVKPPEKSVLLSGREKLRQLAFKCLDIDKDGFLNLKEMHRFSGYLGFKQADEKWIKEFELICTAGGAEVEKGIDEKLFNKLVEDRTDDGFYCSDAEFRDILKELYVNESKPTEGLRKSLIQQTYDAFRKDGADNLGCKALRTFAGYTGFEGDDEAWAEEFEKICEELKVEASAGIDLKSFGILVNDKSAKGIYCSDAELQAMLDRRKNIVKEQVTLDDLDTTTTRAGLQKVIHRLCDVDTDGYLTVEEMGKFAYAAGYDGTDQEWALEYDSCCRRSNTNPRLGLDLAKFIVVTNDGTAGDFDDSELQQVCTKLQLQSKGEVLDRDSLIKSVFVSCDADKDGFLKRIEMKHIGMQIGFKGSDEDWLTEYKALCIDNGADPNQVIDLKMLEHIVNDSGESGCYCSDNDLKAILSATSGVYISVKPAANNNKPAGQRGTGAVVKPPPAKAERNELIKKVFTLYDADKDSCLEVKEMQRFAVHIGFDGSAEEWAEEYKDLLKENKAASVDLMLFTKLVNDKTDGGTYCSDVQLKQILAKLQLGLG